MSSINKHARKKGFTLFEITIVVVIMMGVLAFAIPNFIMVFVRANDADVISSLGKLSAALEVYRILYRTYPDNLSRLTIVNPTLSAGQLLSAGSKGAYNYRFEQSTLSRNTFEIIAEPKPSALGGSHKFKVDQSGNIYRADNIPTVVWCALDPN